ncbi:MAG: zinc ABC transporter substrate-binding protein [Alphaproteobacteria bacterium]|nr:zinc ABC transporter substrate-binding protein [Alphaproteobacteria bacterium]
MRKALVFAVLCALAVVHAPDARAADVVVSLKPIHSLVAGVMGEAGKPRLLLRGAASPHTYQMRPSEARALSEAELIVWIGEAMETFLERPIANLGSKAKIVTLHEAAGLRLLPNREGGIWDDDHLEAHVDEHEDHGHDHGEFNMHIWLDPSNARRIVDVIADALTRLDPDRAGTYRGNAEVMRDRIAALESSLRNRLAPVRRHAFIVFHDAYQYFEFSFGLNGKGAVSLDPARPPGAKRLAELRAALDEHDVRCMFTEPQFESGLVRTVAEGTGIRTAALDPLGVDVEPGLDAWFKIMRGLGDAVSECLGEG